MSKIRENARRLMVSVYKIGGLEYLNDKKSAIKESELCLMYALDDEKIHSQIKISEEWQIPKTTVNTIVKQWERDGLLTLTNIPGKRREMQICLTEPGKKYVKASLEYSYKAEDMAMVKTLKRYPKIFIEAIEYFSVALQEGFEQNEEGI